MVSRLNQNFVPMQDKEQERQRARDAWIDRLENSQPSNPDAAAEQQNSPPKSPTNQRSRAALPDLAQRDPSLQNESSMTHLHNGRAPAAAMMSDAALPDKRGPEGRSTRDAVQC